MTDPIRYASIRDAIFEHDMFDAAGSGALYTLEGIRQVEATWAFESTELALELMRMTEDGLVVPSYGETWNATPTGRIAREARWQQRGLRHPTLTLQTAKPEDLVVALIATTTDGWDVLSNVGFVEAALGVYLFRLGDAVCDASVTSLISRGLVRRELPDGFGWQATLMLTADGRRLYAQEVVSRLGLKPPTSILAAGAPEHLPFEDLGLSHILADNLRFRWEEAERCTDARAWLAAAALYGSILEAVLPDWLRRDEARALQAINAPRDRQKQTVLQLSRWSLESLITVAAELEYIDTSLARHAQALRESRNLIHPDKHLRERSTPDGHLALISQQVVRAVLEALARSTAVGSR